GDWSCDGDGIADNCDENGFTKETEQEEPEAQQSEPAPEQDSEPAEQPAPSAGSQATPDLQVAGTLDVDGKMGPKTVTALQDWLGVEQTGEMNEETTLALQAWANTEQDGVVGEDTVAGLQHEIGAGQNGSDEIDEDTTEALQTLLSLSGSLPASADRSARDRRAASPQLPDGRVTLMGGPAVLVQPPATFTSPALPWPDSDCLPTRRP